MKTLNEYFIDWESDAFGFGYGSGEPHVLPALQRLMALVPIEGAYDYEVLERSLSAPVAWLLLNRLHALDVFDYGSSTRYAWLTDRGKALKLFLEKYEPEVLVGMVCKRGADHNICYPTACNCGPSGYQDGVLCANPFWGRGPLAKP